jgi:CBS domain-containing protein
VDFKLNLNSESVSRTFIDPPLTVAGQTSLREVLQLLKQCRQGHILICEDDCLQGIFTERDVLRLTLEGVSLDQPISELMQSQVDVLSPHDSVGTSIARMAEGGYRHMPVVDKDGRLTGVSRVTGILRYLVEHFPSIVYNLPPKPHHSTQHREGA